MKVLYLKDYAWASWILYSFIMSVPLDYEAVSLKDLLHLRVLAAPNVQAADHRGGAAVEN